LRTTRIRSGISTTSSTRRFSGSSRGGQRDKGIATAANGGSIHVDTFALTWRAAKDRLGWIYFPDDPSNRNVRFSVVSGRTVDEADPMDTKYWIELGPAEASGF